MNKNTILTYLAGTGAALSMFAGVAFAATTVVATPSNTQGFTTADTRTGGSVNYVEDVTSPYGDAALQLTTDATTTSKAQYMHGASTPLADVTELSYATRQISGPVHADASYQLAVYLDGTAASFTTFVYEPYQQTTAILPNVWQAWDVDAGQMWSSRTVNAGGDCTTTAGSGGAPFYTLAGLQTACPNAVVVGFGVNIGSNNPSYDVYTDGVNFNGTTYDFELVEPVVVVGPPTTKDACMNEGWKTFNSPTFKNQGACVSYVQANENAVKTN